MLQVLDLACRRGDRRLFAGLNFACEAHTLLHVRGRNGTGKTTLLRALCGLLHAEAGQIHWRGEDIRELAEDYHRDLLYFGHVNGIKADLTGEENLRIAATLAGDPADDDAIRTALGRIGLAGFEDLPTRMLSQGQKKRVALARLMLSKAPLWILDEPFTALDTDAVDLLQGLIADQVAAGGIVVLTTHQEVALTRGNIRRLTLEPPAASGEPPAASRQPPAVTPQLPAESLQSPAPGDQLATDHWPLATGDSPLTTGDWRLFAGGSKC